jgi:O-acetyl-ADP-ribose deacetylase (regulator of RNase III)
MPYSVSQEDILSVKADAVVVCVEIGGPCIEGRSCRCLAEAGGDALQRAVVRAGFLPVGSAAHTEYPALPFRHVLLCAAPHWLTGKANELLILHRCYQNLLALAEEHGCRSLALPFLSAGYYRFPQDEAVRIALREAEGSDLQLLFCADTPELLALSEKKFRKPEIVSYIGWYRDHALFALDDGQTVRVDLRQERREVAPVPYFEACYRAGNNPLQEPLTEEELARLRQIYAETDW